MIRRLALLLLAMLAPSPAWAEPVVLAAASLRETMSAAADAWAAKGHKRPKLAFAGTPALARQIEAGAPADLFISADEAWVDTLERKRLLRARTRAVFLSNRLVVIVPSRPRQGAVPMVQLADMVSLADLPDLVGGGRLALADAAVPAGRYAQAALVRAGVWRRLARRVVRTDNVRGALALVARGSAAAGVVYATDVAGEPRVRVEYDVPARATPPIRYVVAIPEASRDPDAVPFRAFLLSGEGRRIFTRAGFLPPR